MAPCRGPPMRDRAWQLEGSREPVNVDTPKTIDSRLVYEGRVVKMRVDEVLLPNGVATTREVLDHPGAVVIVALDQEQRVYLVRQYRHAIARVLLELPAGTLEPGEEPIDTAKRELLEEVGLTAKRWSFLGSIFSSPGFVNEELHVFLAEDLTQQENAPDIDEDLTVLTVPLAELESGRLETPDAKTLAALYLLREASLHGDEE